MRRHKVLGAVLALAWALAPAARAQGTRYILADTILQTDRQPDAFRAPQAADGKQVPDPDLAALQGALEASFDRKFPSQERTLSLEHRLDPDQPTLVVLPRLSVVRLNRDTLAGSLDRFEAVVVGDISLMDPWSMTRLFSATRMATRITEVLVNLGEGERDQMIHEAFLAAGRAWLDDCLAEIARNAHPFTLKGRILPSQSGIWLRGGGGFWPFGRLDGVKPRMMLTGPNGKLGRVREVFDHFSLLESVAKPNSSLAADEEYRATLVASGAPAERAEPRVAIRWVGPEPETGAGMRTPPSGAGWSSLLADYLAKSGGLRLLPIEEDREQNALARLTEHLNTFSKQTANAMDLADAAVRAKEAPDLLAQIGIADSYHGTSPGEDGVVDHRFHVTWAVRWFGRQDADGDEGGAPLVFRGVQFQSEDRTVRTKPGLRELDLSSVWFNLCRDGVIKLAKAIESGLQPMGRQGRGLAQGGGKVAWQGPPPGLRAQLTLHPFKGSVVNRDGKVLGSYFGKAETLSTKQLDRCAAGDEITFTSGNRGPLVGVLPPDLAPGVRLKPVWAQASLAARAAKIGPMQLVLLDDPGAPAPAGKDGALLRLRVDTPVCAPRGEAVMLGHTYRFRVYTGSYDPQGVPAIKPVGLQHSGLYPAGAPYLPAALGAAALAEQNAALDDLCKLLPNPGLYQALQ
jgi:hypothetical protein